MSTSWSQKISILLLVAFLSATGAAFGHSPGQSPTPPPEPAGATSINLLTTLQGWWAQAWAELGLDSTAGASAERGPGMEPPGQTDTGEGGPEMCPAGLHHGGPGMDPAGLTDGGPEMDPNG